MGLIEDRDAQFMLLAAFIIAVGLVITTVVLNSIIFEGNMVIGPGNELPKNEIINIIQVTRDEVRSAYRNVTAPGQNDSLKFNNFTIQTRNFAANLSKIYALRGGAVNVSLDISNWVDGRYANFTENGTAGSSTNWTVMENVRNISVFELRNVSGSNLEINITNQTTGAFLWSLKLNGTDNITVRNPGGFVCNCTVNFTFINILDSPYSFGTTVGTNISNIRFLNGIDASGRFNINGNTTYGRNFTRARDYLLDITLMLSTSRMQANMTIPSSVPW